MSNECPQLKLTRAWPGMLACALVLCAACGDDGHATTYAPISGRDSGVRRTRDAAATGAPALDAGAFDHVIRSGDLELCGYDDADALEFDGSAQLGEVAIANDEQAFSLAFHAADSGLWLRSIPITGSADAPEKIVSAGEQPVAAALATSAKHVLLAWRSDRGSAPLLQAREPSAPASAAIELTKTLAGVKGGGQLFSLLGLDQGFVIAFVQVAQGKPELRVQRVDSSGRAQGAALRIADVGARSPLDLHLARLDAGKILLAWLERDTGGDGHVFGLVLSPELAAQGKPAELSQFAAHDARFDLAARSMSAGLVYHALDGGTRDAIKYRRIAADGSVSEPAFNVLEAPGRARDASIAAFGQGYAVAYRALPALGFDHAAVRVAFINQFGVIVHVAELAETSEQGGRTTLSATADGHVLVGYTHVAPASAATRALKMYCPGALVLCGGTVH